MAEDVTKPAKPPIWNDPVYRALFFQVLVLGGVFALGYTLVSNTLSNLERQGIASGFGFMETTAGFSILMSLIASCKANHVEPWAWLRDVITELPKGTAHENLLPDRWLDSHPQHRWTIADQRRRERTAKGNL